VPQHDLRPTDDPVAVPRRDEAQLPLPLAHRTTSNRGAR
jgi:hypothetical protein